MLWGTGGAKVRGLTARIVTSCQASLSHSILIILFLASRDRFWCRVWLEGRLGGTQKVMFVVDVLPHLSLLRL